MLLSIRLSDNKIFGRRTKLTYTYKRKPNLFSTYVEIKKRTMTLFRIVFIFRTPH